MIQEFKLTCGRCEEELSVNFYDLLPLDKTNKNWEKTEMPLVISTLTAAISLGEFLLKKYKKDVVAQQSLDDSISSDALLQNLDKYDAFYDRFKTEVLETAISYRNDLSMLSLPAVTDYYKI